MSLCVKKLTVDKQLFFTLSPSLEVATSDRGRGMNDWEFERIKYHYDTGVANPKFGEIIDSTDMSLEQAVDKIIDIVRNNIIQNC